MPFQYLWGCSHLCYHPQEGSTKSPNGLEEVGELSNDAHKELLREKGEWGKSDNNFMTSYNVTDP